eukprot:2935289-Pyramimonas_sp.AAC.1
MANREKRFPDDRAVDDERELSERSRGLWPNDRGQRCRIESQAPAGYGEDEGTGPSSAGNYRLHRL